MGVGMRLNSAPDIPLRRMAQAVRVGVRITSYYGLDVDRARTDLFIVS